MSGPMANTSSRSISGHRRAPPPASVPSGVTIMITPKIGVPAHPSSSRWRSGPETFSPATFLPPRFDWV